METENKTAEYVSEDQEFLGLQTDGTDAKLFISCLNLKLNNKSSNLQKKAKVRKDYIMVTVVIMVYFDNRG